MNIGPKWLAYGAGVALAAILAAAIMLMKVRGPDYLSQANAYEKLGQLDSVEALLQRHVLRHPTDLATRLRYGRLVLDRGDTTKGIRVLQEVRVDATGRDTVQWSTAGGILAAVGRTRGDAADSVARAFFSRGRFDSAAAHAASATQQYLQVRALHMSMADSAILRGFDNYSVAEAGAYYALAWYLGQEGSTSGYSLVLKTGVTGLDSALWNLTLMTIQSVMDSVASAAFDARKWTQAEKHYLLLRSLAHLAKDSSEEARELYNAAMADVNGGRYSESRNLLSTLRDSFPSYAQRDVRSQIAGLGETEARRGVADLLRKAGAAFNDKKYQSARNLYRDALSTIEARSLNVPNWVAETMYNIAVTYYNEREYDEARARLEELRSRFPAYDSELVKDLLRKIP